MNVKFYSVKLKSTFDALETKDNLALYWISETSELYKGDQLFGTGALATRAAAGLLSAKDKEKLDNLVSGKWIENLVAVDGTIKINNIENGKSVGVAVSTKDGNALVAVEDGLFVPVAQDVSVPEYTLEKQSVAEDGYVASYKLKKTVDGESAYVGDTINIGKDMVIHSATLETVTESGIPYDGAEIGEPYIDMAFNDINASHIYIPVKGLVDTYTPGNGIDIVNGKVSVKIADESNGLSAVDGALLINLATSKTAGAMSAVDKAFIDSIPNNYATISRLDKTVEKVKYEISSKPYGTLVNYGENEIRVMCPADTKWTKQSVGGAGNSNMYYMGFKAYAPDGAVSFKEGDRGVIVDEMFDFNGDFAGTDEFGRNYSICWLALAMYNETSDSWTYFGKNSSAEKYVGWDYVVEWYDENGVVIASDSIRINLSNEECHKSVIPYYMNNYATVTQINEIEKNVNNSYTWGEL